MRSFSFEMNLSWSQKIALRHFVITLSLSMLFFVIVFIVEYRSSYASFESSGQHRAEIFAAFYEDSNRLPSLSAEDRVQGFWVIANNKILLAQGELRQDILYQQESHPFLFISKVSMQDGSDFVYAYIPKDYDPHKKIPLYLFLSFLMGSLMFLVIQYFHQKFFAGIHALENLKSTQINKEEIARILMTHVFPTFKPLGLSIMKIVERYHDSESLLHEGNSRLKLALWAGESGFWEWDFLHDELYLSDSAKSLLGLYSMTDEISINKNFLAYVHPSQRTLVEQSLEQLLKGESHAIDLELSLVIKDHYEWFSVKGKITSRDPSGKGMKISGLIHNIQDRKDLLANLSMFEKAFELIQESIMIIDTNFKITYVNESFEKTTGYSQSTINNKPLSTLYSDKHEPMFYKQLVLTLNKEGSWSGELWMQREDQSIFPEWLSLDSVCDKQGNTAYYIGVFTDLTQRKRQDDTLKFLSNFDPLTSLPNKNQFLVHLAKMIQTHGQKKTSLAVMIIAINDLSKINEAYGHMLTDYAIRVVAERFKGKVEHDEHLARISSDEFGVIIDHQDIGSLNKIIEQFQSCVKYPINIDTHDVVLSSAIGYTVYPRDAKNSSHMMKNAHTACSFAKQKSPNFVKEYDSDIDRKNTEKKQMEDYLRKALARGELSIHYQPKVCLKTNIVLGSEALVRWDHEHLGWVSPAIFVPLAEETGLINLLGEWVLHEACRQNLKWYEMGYKDLVVGVNLSASQFKTGDFAHLVAQALWDIGLPPNLLELELTESLVMEEPEKCKLMLLVLKKMGVKISVDDFGTGYSSLSHIREFPIDTLKIDRSFVKDLLDDEEAISIIKAIIAMAKSMHLSVIAEGVEHKAQADIIRDLGCDALQGFYIAKALPPDQFTALLEKHNQKSS